MGVGVGGEVQGWERSRGDNFDGDGDGVYERYVQVCLEGNRPRRRDNSRKAFAMCLV